MRTVFSGDPEKGVLVIVAMPTCGNLCLLGADPKKPPDIPGIRICYDPSDHSSSLALQLIRGMRRNGIPPRMYAWEENAKGEVAILFNYSNPPEALWRPIGGVEALAISRCVRIFTTCEPDYPLEAWRSCMKSFREKNLFILQIMSGDSCWAEFALTAIQMSKPVIMTA